MFSIFFFFSNVCLDRSCDLNNLLVRYLHSKATERKRIVAQVGKLIKLLMPTFITRKEITRKKKDMSHLCVDCKTPLLFAFFSFTRITTIGNDK